MSGSDLVRNARPWLSVGWLAKGSLFVIIGVLGLEIARRGFASESADQQGALQELASTPFGRVGVFVVALGLLAYAIWQGGAAITRGTDTDDVDPEDLLHTAKRIGWAGLSLLYGLLAVTGLEIAWRGEGAVDDGKDGATSPPGIADRLLDVPAGWLLAVAVGLGTLAVAAYQLRKGMRAEFLDDIDTAGLGRWTRRALTALGAAGFVARALLVGVAGWLFVDAAWSRDADEAAGLDRSLHTLAEATAGQALLTACALGLVAAGVYDMVTFRRQRIDAVE